MKKIIIFFSLIIAICIFEGKIKQNVTSYYLNFIFGQSSDGNLFERKDGIADLTITSNKTKILHSYNPPKAYLAICVVCSITLFVISQKYKFDVQDMTMFS